MNLAIVGCGMVANDHLRALKGIRGIKVIALCDKDEETVTRMSRKWNVGTYYTDYRKMLDEQNPSIISILTPPHLHVPIAIEAIKRGVNVLIEKPLTLSAADAYPLLEKLRDNRAKLTVDHIMLFSKIMTRTFHLIKCGIVGDVLGVRIEFLGTQDDFMTSTESHWCHKLPGGRIGEMLPHPVYTVQSLVNDELIVDSVVTQKRGKHPWMQYDELTVSLHGRNKGWADIYVSFNAPRPVITIDVYGTRKILKIDMINQTLLELGERSSSKVDSAKDLLGQSCNLFLWTIKNTAGFLRARRMEYSLRNLYVSFMESVASGTDPVVTPQMAFETVRITEKICNMI